MIQLETEDKVLLGGPDHHHHQQLNRPIDHMVSC